MVRTQFTEDMLDFFDLCAKGMEVNKEVVPRRMYIYDNRIDNIPSQARSSYATHSVKELSAWFSIFLAVKFKFLHSLLQGVAEDKIIKRTLGIDTEDQHWKEITSIWRKEADAERLAYLNRIYQLGLETTQNEWYNDLPEFLEWSKLCQSQIESRWKTFVKSEFDKAYTEIWEMFQNDTMLSLEDDRVLERSHLNITAGLKSDVSIILSHLTEFDSPKEKIAELKKHFNSKAKKSDNPIIYISPSSIIAEKVIPKFMEMLVSEEVSEDAYICAFIKIVKEVFQCAICDYLEVTEAGKLVRIRSTSLDISEEDLRKKLGESEKYMRGEGITGSILVNPVPGIGLHVGTNNLAQDPRMSPWHSSAYEKIYGPTYNFWVFPIFRDSEMVAMFRVINREGDKGGFWPYYVRLQLVETANWFEQFWRIVKHLLIELEKHRIYGNSEHVEPARQLIDRFELSWVSEAFLGQLLKHLVSVVHRKVEDQRIGCCIGVIADQEIETLRHTLQKYTTVERIEKRSLEDISQFYTRVSPMMGMFVLNKDGVFQEVKELQYPEGTRGIESIKGLTKSYSSIIFLVERNKESIRIFYKGSLSAEYYLSHLKGSWKLRFYQEIYDKVNNIVSDISPRVLDRLYRQAWQLSYNEIGSMIVIADEMPEFIKQSSGSSLDVSLDNLTEEEFEDLAKIDGAVIVSPQGIVSKAGVIFQVENPVISPEAEQLISESQKGSRHSTAATVSLAVPSDLICVVSKNRGISFFYGGKPIVWDI